MESKGTVPGKNGHSLFFSLAIKGENGYYWDTLSEVIRLEAICSATRNCGRPLHALQRSLLRRVRASSNQCISSGHFSYTLIA